jgi:hypothetical protein
MRVIFPQPVADILVRRFYCWDKYSRLDSPLYAIPLIEAADINWFQTGKHKVTIFPHEKKLIELNREQIELFEPHVRQLNWCFTFLKPIFDPGVSIPELRMMARIGLVIAPLDKL